MTVRRVFIIRGFGSKKDSNGQPFDILYQTGQAKCDPRKLMHVNRFVTKEKPRTQK
jgi:hypothetical protein